MAQDYTPEVQGAYGEGNGLMVIVLVLGTRFADDFVKRGFTINGRFWRNEPVHFFKIDPRY